MLCSVGCGPSTPPPRSTPAAAPASSEQATAVPAGNQQGDSDRSAQTTPEAAPAPAPRDQRAPAPPGTIRRADLERVLDRGAQAYVAGLRVRPAFRNGRFRGWRVVSYAHGDALRKGDVVLRVNGRSVEKPDQAMAVWNELRMATELEVTLLRGGKPKVLRYDIVE